jgi:hypothetical protein
MVRLLVKLGADYNCPNADGTVRSRFLRVVTRL